MRYKTFRIVVVCLGILGFGELAKVTYNALESPAATNTVAPRPSSPVQNSTVQPTYKVVTTPTTADIREAIENWLTQNPDRFGQMKLVNFLPTAPYRATAIRFQETEAAKWTSDPRQWSQIRLDLNRDGVDDEKWLLKNGHTYKREVIDRQGRTTFSEHF